MPSPAVNSLLSRSKSTTALTLCAIMVSFLTGCGGGGGGSDSAATPAPAPAPAPETVQLAINSNNAVDAATNSLGYSELAFEFGEAALTVIDETSKKSIFPATAACDGGTQIDDFIDNDSNHMPSPGDVLKTTYNHCHDATLNGTISGTITLTLSPPPASTYTTRWAGKIEFSNFEIILDNEPSVLIGLSGSISFNSSVDLVTSILDISTPTSGFNISAQSNSRNITEKIIVSSGRKTVQYNLARYTFELNSTMQSQILGGAVTIQTPTPISGPLGSLPDTGVIATLGGANSSAKFSTGAGTNYGQATFTVTSNGTTPTGTLYAWGMLSDGYIWNDNLNNNPYYYIQPPPAYFSTLYTDLPVTGATTIVSVTQAIKVQFNKPINVNQLPTVSFTPQATYPSNPEVQPIAADVEAHGALLVLTPHTQLKHGTTYSLTASSNFLSVDGESSYLYAPSFSTPDSVAAVISTSKNYGFPGDIVGLDASGSRSDLGSLTYTWRQVSGQTASLSNTTGPTLSFTVPALAANRDLLKFEVKAVASNGEFETKNFEFPVYASAQYVELFYYTSDSPYEWIGKGQTKLIANPPYIVTTLSFNYGQPSIYFYFGTSNYSSNASLSFSTPNQALQTGQYSNATRYPFNTTGPGLNVDMDAAGCSTLTGTFNVLEISFNGDGSIATFAADFIQHCEGGTAALRGAVRFHSAIPLPTTWPF